VGRPCWVGSRGRLSTRALLVGTAFALLAGSATIVPGTPALASHHNPTAGELSASRATVARRERQLKDAAAALGHAQGQLKKLNTVAEVAVEAYDGARAKLAIAQQAAVTAHRVLNAANVQVAKGQRQLIKFAQFAYESGGMSTIDVFLSPGGPRRLVSRVGALAVISASQRTTLQRLDAARVYQGVVAQQANAVAATAASAAAAAAKAKADATTAVAHQHAVLSQMRQQQTELNTLLARARGRANQLQRQHLAAVARAQAEAAAAPTIYTGAHPYAGASGSLAGTISAATGLSAVHVAEQQIGKPYQWGGAGPNTFDCSGLVMWSYDQVGVHLDHWTGFQWNEGAHVSQSELRPGDLVFFAYDTTDPSTIHHVGMYIGKGEMVEAPHTGANVRISNYSRPDYIGAVRPYQR
jgi:cell wall-associated NlpC family hydrolase